jgi:hypothetical protein
VNNREVYLNIAESNCVVMSDFAKRAKRMNGDSRWQFVSGLKRYMRDS